MPPKKPRTGRTRGRGKRSVASTKPELRAPPALIPEIQQQPESEIAVQLTGDKEARTESSAPSLSTQESGSLSSSSSSDTEKKKSRRSPEKRRKAKEQANLTATQEEEIFEWLMANPVLYLRGMAGCKDVQSRNSSWADKAAEMGSTDKQLKDISYKSVRTRVGRLMKKKFGGPQFDV